MLSKPSYNPETVERCLANGRKFKETFNETRTVTVVQWERQDLREFELEFGRELFYLKAKINPQTDIDDEGYVTQAWIEMVLVKDVQEIDGRIWAFMKPSAFSNPDPIVYFRTYIDDVEARLIPHPDF